MQRGVLWPACLPSTIHKGTRGIFAGWSAPLDLAAYYGNQQRNYNALFYTVAQYMQENFILHHIEVEKVQCNDPSWMKSNSPYPAGTICARDPSQQSCFDAGDSGGGLMMERLQGGYSWEGTLSAYKGCDRAINNGGNVYTIQGENPAIFTQGSCFLPWIAAT